MHDEPKGETGNNAEGPEVRSELDEGLDDLRKLARGLAGKLLGPRMGDDEPPARPIISPEADEAIDNLGATLGHWLRAAGDSMLAHPGDPEEAMRETTERARAEEPTQEIDDEGWSPLVQGARAFGAGLGLMAGELFSAVEESREQAGEAPVEEAETEPPPATD